VETPNESQVKLQKLKTLACSYPWDRDISFALQYLIGKAPALKHLKLLDCGSGFGSDDVQYCWNSCQELEEIMLYSDKLENKVLGRIYRSCNIHLSSYWGMTTRCLCGRHGVDYDLPQYRRRRCV